MTSRKEYNRVELELIEKAKTFCLDNYENGFDAFVECYENDEWIELATKENGELMTWQELLTEIKITQKIRADYAAEYIPTHMD